MSDRLQDIKRWLAKGERILPAELDWLIVQLEQAREAVDEFCARTCSPAKTYPCRLCPLGKLKDPEGRW